MAVTWIAALCLAAWFELSKIVSFYQHYSKCFIVVYPYIRHLVRNIEIILFPTDLFQVDAKKHDVYNDDMAKKKETRGRPRSQTPLRKRFFRCTDDEWELIEQAADGGNRSQLIRTASVRHAKAKLKKNGSKTT